MKSKLTIKNEVKFEILSTLDFVVENFHNSTLKESLDDKDQIIALDEMIFQKKRIEKFIKWNRME